MTRKGRKNVPVYRIVVADSRAPRDGKFLEQVGFYDPQQTPVDLRFEADAIIGWLQKGAQPSDTVRSLLKQVGLWAKYEAVRAGQDVSNFVLKPQAPRSRTRKPAPKAVKRAEAAAKADEAAKAAAAAPAPAADAS
jgi:small subunit ribosomal protein S16